MKSKSKNIAIIGAGISGLSCGLLLQERGHKVKIFEKASSPGGLIRCTLEDGNLFHRVGGHVFNTKIPKVEKWFWSYFNKAEDFRFSRRNAKILMDEKLLGYPLENYLYAFDSETIEKVINELFLIKEKGDDKNDKNENFDEFLKNNFGETLYHLYFKPYNSKIWNTDLSLVPLPWLDGKLPMPNFKDILLRNIKREEESQMVHSTFNYPNRNGSSFIAERFAENLNVSYNCNIKEIEYSDGQYMINGETFDALVYTADIRMIDKILKIEDERFQLLSESLKSLKSNGTSNVLCYTDDSDLSWMYLPNENVLPHRIIYTGNFSPNNNKENKLTCTVEFSGMVDQVTINKELKKLPGNLVPIAYNQEPNSYVIQDFDTRDVIKEVKGILEPKNVFLCGRFAEWEYYNMDKAIESAMDLAEENF